MAKTLGAKQKPMSEREEEAAAAENSAPEPILNEDPEARLASTLLNGLADLRKLDEKITAATAVVKSLRGDRKSVVAKLDAAGLPASQIKEAMEDAEREDDENVQREKSRQFIRKTINLPGADWYASFEGLPHGVDDEQKWYQRGLKAGALAHDREPPAECPPGRCVQEFMRGWDEKQLERAMEFSKADTASFD